MTDHRSPITDYFLRIEVAFILLLFAVPHQAQDLTQKAFSHVNSARDEQSPVISPDGKVIYWTVANHPDNVGGKVDTGDIWYAVWTGEEWSLPIHGGKAINNERYNAVAGISEDGEKLFLVDHYKTKSQGLAVSIRMAEGWSMPEDINIPYFMNRSGGTHGYFSSTLSVLVFSAESYGTLGVEDIYVTFLESGKWTEPMNLGRKINTKYQDVSPSISSDGRYLYFASNGRKGYGSFDIYFAERLDDSWQQWSEPVNMGASVNSEGRELYYRTIPETRSALFTSTLNSDGLADIKYFRLPDDLPDSLLETAPDTIVKIVPIIREKAIGPDEKFFRVYGRI